MQTVDLKDLKIGDFVEFVKRQEPSSQDGADVPSDGARWSACRTFSDRMHRIRPEIEKANHGTFLPTYARLWSKDGKPWSKERALMPGYLFFLTDPEGWGNVRNIDGVCGVLTNEGRASKVSDDEMRRLVLDHAMGVHNRIEPGGLANPAKQRYGRRRRRPRSGKRMRQAV